MVAGLMAVLVSGFGCSGENANQLFKQGVDAMAADKPDEAVIWFKKALQQNPELALAHYKLGQIYREKRESKLAYSHLAQAVQQDTKMAEARKEMIFLLVENRALEQVVKVCKEYLEINGDDKEVSLILGNSLAYLKRPDEAVEVLRVATEKYPESLKAWTNRAKILVSTGDVQAGRSMLEKLAQENPDAIEVQISLAQLYEKLQRYDLALFTLEALKSKHPDNPRPYALLAQLSLKKNQLGQAKNILLNAENAGVQDSVLFRLHAMILHRQGDSVSALKYFKKAVTAATDVSRPFNQMVLADYLTFLKKYQEAQQILETIIAEDSTRKELKSKVVELFLAQGEFDQARNSVDALLKEDSGDARGHFLKGLMMMKEKDVIEAREQFSKAKELDPNAAENQFLYGLTFMEESQDISITEISEALKKNPNLMKARMALAELYEKKGDLQASLDEPDKVIEKQGADINARALRISVLLKMGNPEAALADAQWLVDKQPDVAWHRFRLAEIYFFTQKYDKALPLYEKLQEEKPESVQILNRIVAIHMLTKRYEKAMELSDSFLAKFPDSGHAVIVKAKIYISQGYFDLAENVLLPEADKGKEVTPIVMLAELYRKKNDNEKAVQYYRKALELVPKNINLLMKLAGFYLENGEYSEAIATYENVLQQKTDFIPAMNNLAYLYTEKGGNLERALELASMVVRKMPDNPDATDTLGWIYVKKGVYSQAEPYLQIAINAKPDHPAIMYHMGMLRFGQKNTQDAEKLLTRAIQKGLSGTELVKANEALAELKASKEKLQKAVSEKEKGNAAQAMALLEALLDSEGFSSDAAGNLAMLYAEQDKDITKALELAQKAYDAQPGDPTIADALGWVYYHQGSLLMAKQYIEQALDKDDAYGPAYVHLGAVYLKKKEPEAARTAFKTAKSMKLSRADQKQLDTLLLELGT